MRVTIAREARRDIDAICEWVSQDSRAAGNRLIGRLLLAAQALGKYPMRYPLVPELALRKRPCGNYLIFYRVTDSVEVLRILHSARDWPAILADDLN